LRLSADRSKEVSFEAQLDRPERAETVGDGKNSLLMIGQLNNGVGDAGVRYAARVRVLNHGGEVSVGENRLRVKEADEVILLAAGRTDFQGFVGRQTKDPAAATRIDLNKAARKPYEVLRQAHVEDYRKYFQRVSFYLEPSGLMVANVGTRAKLRTYNNGHSVFRNGDGACVIGPPCCQASRDQEYPPDTVRLSTAII
jgi:alpha-L-fucosidase 2